MTKLRNTLRKRLIVFIVFLLVLVGGSVVWWQEGTAAPDPTDRTPVMFVVREGDGVRSIVTHLAEERLIGSKTSFYILIKFLGIERDIQAGNFRLNRGMDAKTVAEELTHGVLDTWVTTLEGWRNEEIANALAKDLDIPESEFLGVARVGYMFPDTYLIPKDVAAAQIAEYFIKNFDKKVTSAMREDAKKTGLMFDQAITLASIVEREGRTNEDRPIIAGILLKRLKADWPLQVDATIQFALGYQSVEKSWWKKSLTNADKTLKSPYNTYLHTGLPPGPISNPGLASINAVIYPVQTDYWYYIHDSSGVAHFAKTLEEHEANIARYLSS